MVPEYKTQIIEAFLEKYGGAGDDIVFFVWNKYNDLVNTYGYSVIHKIEDACTEQILSDDTAECRKAVAKLTKQEIFEVCATVAFLSGICVGYEEVMVG